MEKEIIKESIKEEEQFSGVNAQIAVGLTNEELKRWKDLLFTDSEIIAWIKVAEVYDPEIAKKLRDEGKTPYNTAEEVAEIRKSEEGLIREKSDVQSVLISKDSYSEGSAKEWVKNHGFKIGDLDVTDQYYRFRQFDPTSKRKRTKEIKDGVKFIIEFE